MLADRRAATGSRREIIVDQDEVVVWMAARISSLLPRRCWSWRRVRALRLTASAVPLARPKMYIFDLTTMTFAR